MAAPCTCPEVPLTPAWTELQNSYGTVSNNDPNYAPLFPHNLLSKAASQFACGRLRCASHRSPLPPAPHDPSEVLRCAALAAATVAAFGAAAIGKGDEGDHYFAPLALPAVAGGAGGGAGAGPVSCVELHAALGGALAPTLLFEARALGEEVEGMRAEAEGDEGWGAWGAAAAALAAGGAARLTYLRPLEGRGLGPCVFPHFVVGVTGAGSLVGAWAATVWT